MLVMTRFESTAFYHHRFPVKSLNVLYILAKKMCVLLPAGKQWTGLPSHSEGQV